MACYQGQKAKNVFKSDIEQLLIIIRQAHMYWDFFLIISLSVINKLFWDFKRLLNKKNLLALSSYNVK